MSDLPAATGGGLTGPAIKCTQYVREGEVEEL